MPVFHGIDHYRLNRQPVSAPVHSCNSDATEGEGDHVLRYPMQQFQCFCNRLAKPKILMQLIRSIFTRG